MAESGSKPTFDIEAKPSVVSYLIEKAAIVFVILFAIGFMYVFFNLIGLKAILILAGAFILFGIVKTCFFIFIR